MPALLSSQRVKSSLSPFRRFVSRHPESPLDSFPRPSPRHRWIVLSLNCALGPWSVDSHSVRHWAVTPAASHVRCITTNPPIFLPSHRVSPWPRRFACAGMGTWHNSNANFANVAQLVEQRFRKPQVVGSIPTVGSSFLIHDVAAIQFRGGSFGRARRGVSGSFVPKQFGLASNPL